MRHAGCQGKATVFFASAVPERLERSCTLPAKFQRLLDRLLVPERLAGKKVAVKMHLGGGLGYSTIHPLFVKLLVDHLKKCGATDIFVTDGEVKNATQRGYCEQTIGARLIPAFGEEKNEVVRKRTGWSHLKSVLLSRPILAADVLIAFSHVKGHGDSGFGGACKNLAMGCVPNKTRSAIHVLEGTLEWDRAKCIRCNKCIEECPMKANKFTDNGEYTIFWHHCKLCRHCMLICPTGAIRIPERKFDLFQEGLARVSKLVMDQFPSGNVFFINVLTAITIFCDCWGMTTPALVPDIGIMASEDIVAVETASLRSIKTKNLIPGSITPPYRLGKGKHLFERLHSRDPFVQVRSLEKLGAGTSRYRLVEIK